MPLDAVVATSSHTAEECLQMTLKRCYATAFNKSLLKQIFFSWPSLHAVTLRLASVLGDSFPVERTEGNLLAACINDAAAAYGRSHEDVSHELVPAVAYMEALLSRASIGLAAYDVYGVRSDGSQRWCLTDCGGLVEFSRAWERLEFYGVEVTPSLVDGTHFILASRVLNVEDAQLLCRVLQLRNTSASSDEVRSKAPVIPLSIAKQVASA